jgi:hypothetical protein
MHAVHHLVSGEYIIKESDNIIHPKVGRVGREVLKLVNDKVFIKLMGMQKLLGHSKQGGSESQVCQHLQGSHRVIQAYSPWTLKNPRCCGRQLSLVYCTPAHCTSVNDSSVIHKCSATILHDDYVTRVGSFILFYTGNSTAANLPHIGHILEILADARAGHLLSLLIQKYMVGEPCLPYQFPRLFPLPSEPVFCRLKVRDNVNSVYGLWLKYNTFMQNCISTINVIHNCVAHGCSMTRTRPVIQERSITDFLENEIKHTIQPDDILLNLAQLHSAKLVQKFQPLVQYPNLPRDTLLRTAIRNCHLLEGSATTNIYHSPPGVNANPSLSPHSPSLNNTLVHSDYDPRVP